MLPKVFLYATLRKEINSNTRTVRCTVQSSEKKYFFAKSKKI